MVSLRISTTPISTSAFRRDFASYRRDVRRAGFDVTDEVARKAQRHIQAKMRSVGLGKLANAVGATSAKRKRQFNQNAYGAIFAKGGDDTLAGGALEAYSRGTSIYPRRGKWLAYPTDAAPRLVVSGGRRRRLQPGKWDEAGLTATIGKLIFVPVSANMALLVVRKVSISPKTGRARALGKRMPRTRIVPKGNTVVFVLIRMTSRAKRFDKDEIFGFYANRIPDYIARTIAGYRTSS